MGLVGRGSEAPLFASIYALPSPISHVLANANVVLNFITLSPGSLVVV